MFLCDMILILFLTIVSYSNSARILGIIPTPSVSHNAVAQPLWKELSLRGHQVTTLTTDPINDPQLINLTEIDLSFSYKILHENLQETIYLNQLSFYEVLTLLLANICDKQLEHFLVQEIIKNETETFDLIIVESSRPAVLAFAHRFNCPIIGITALDATPTMHSLLGNPTHPILYPDTWISLGEASSIFNRILRVIYDTYFFIFQVTTVFPLYDRIVEKNFGKGYPPVIELLKNISIQFTNTDPVFYSIRALVPGIVQIGGALHRVPRKPLSKDLEVVLDNAVHGFIYFSLGSYAKSQSLPEEITMTILETFAELPYIVLWKFESENIPKKTKNVIISKWFSQIHVLNHPNIKLFITHGGLQSLTEAVNAKVPLIGMPFFADQSLNIKNMVKKGCALQLQYNKLEKNEFKNTILEVILNPKYRNKMEELSNLVKDQPMTGLERAVWWTEYVLRHKGARHLRSPSIDIPFYQYYLLDVLAVLIIALIVSFYMIIFIFKLLIQFIKYYILGKEKDKTN